MSKPIWFLSKSDKKTKKYFVTSPSGKKVYFGAKGYQDFTMHKDPERKQRYINRHSGGGREDWSKKGLETAGFWSRWLLWNEPTIESSIKSIEKKFGIKIKSS